MAHFSLEAFEETVSPINFHRHPHTLCTFVNDIIQIKLSWRSDKWKIFLFSMANHIYRTPHVSSRHPILIKKRQRFCSGRSFRAPESGGFSCILRSINMGKLSNLTKSGKCVRFGRLNFLDRFELFFCENWNAMQRVSFEEKDPTQGVLGFPGLA